MFRAVMFLAKIALLVAAAVWIADHPGQVRIEWMDYTLTVQTGVFFLLAIFVILLAIFIYQFISGLVRFPKSLRRYREVRKQEAGYKALTLGLAAVAAGDSKIAAYQSFRARNLLPDNDGLPLLLKAQAERLQGQEEAAQKTFDELTHNKDASFLGVRGLLQAALDSKNYPKALELARRALDMYPRQAWILKLVYELEIRQQNWEEAQVILYRAEKAGAILPAKAQSDRIAIFIARAEKNLELGFRERALKNLQQAYKYGGSFVPAAAALARMYRDEGSRRKAIAVLYRAWQKTPHPDLARIWETLMPPGKSAKPLARLLWAEKLAALNTRDPESHLFAGRVAMEESLWGEAREHFRKAENMEPSARLYWLWANLEKRAGANPRLVQSLQEKAAAFPPEKCWVCRETGRIYEQWHPVAQPHGAFNTIEWDYPHGPSASFPVIGSEAGDVVIEAPRLHYAS